MNFGSSKRLGGIGALIVYFTTIITYIIILIFKYSINTYNILVITGCIVIVLSLYYLSSFYQSKSIFTHARLGVLVLIIVPIISMVCSRWIFAPIVVNSITGALSFYLYFVIFVVFYIVAAFFVRRSLNELAARSGVSLFATAGLLLFIGAILTLIVIGALIMWVSFVVLAIAFFKLKEPQPSLLHTEISTSPTSSYQMISEVNVKADFCSNCGTPTTPQAVFCAHCGKQTAQ